MYGTLHVLNNNTTMHCIIGDSSQFLETLVTSCFTGTEGVPRDLLAHLRQQHVTYVQCQDVLGSKNACIYVFVYVYIQCVCKYNVKLTLLLTSSKRLLTGSKSAL